MDLDQIKGRNSLLWGWWDTGTCCQRSPECLGIGSIQGQAGWAFEQPGLVKDVSA